MIKRIAFTFISRHKWTGGYNYLLNLFCAIGMHQRDRLRPILFVGDEIESEEITPFKEMQHIEIVRSPIFNESSKALRLLEAITTGIDSKAAAIFKKNGIDVAFENSIFYGWKFPFKTIAWLPDFQHRHLKHLFGFSAYWKRDIGFWAQTHSNRLIMLSSEDAQSDCVRFYPASKTHAVVVKFSVLAHDLFLNSIDSVELTRHYGLPPHFFYLPNQFWVHKNHRLVIEALKVLNDKGKKVFVVTSGNSNDPRCKRLFTDLSNLVQTLGLTGQFRFLGLVPRAHVIALMRACDAMINPSLFEGWSTTVEESRALGVPIILSDLPVLREQMGDLASYFDPFSITDLAEKLCSFEPLDSTKRGEREMRGKIEMPARFEKFAHDFEQVVRRLFNHPSIS
jgi:glycosyltransferase involved in cell wall biosynthesis